MTDAEPDYTVPVWDEVSAREHAKSPIETRAGTLKAENQGIDASTMTRQHLLSQPSDSKLLQDCAKVLCERHHAKTSSKGGGEIVATKLMLGKAKSVCEQFPRFCEILRINEFKAALSAGHVAKRSATWLVSLIEEIYDDFAREYSACESHVGQHCPVSKSTLISPPEIAAEYFWRRLGSAAPMTAFTFLLEINRASLRVSADVQLFRSFLSENRDTDALAAVLYARGYLESHYSLSLRKVTQRTLTGVDGRNGKWSVLPRRGECPLLVPGATFTRKPLRNTQGPLHDQTTMLVLLPRAAVAKLVRALVGEARESERAAQDERCARGLSRTQRPHKSGLSDYRTDDNEAFGVSEKGVTPSILAKTLLNMLEDIFYERSSQQANLFSKAPTGAKPAFSKLSTCDAFACNQEYAEMGNILMALADTMSRIPDDLMAYVKFGRDRDTAAVLDAVRAALSDTNDADKLSAAVREAERGKARANAILYSMKVRFAQLEARLEHSKRFNASVQAKTNILIAEGDAARAENLFTERRARMNALEHRAELAWNTLLNGSGRHAAKLGHNEDHISTPVRTVFAIGSLEHPARFRLVAPFAYCAHILLGKALKERVIVRAAT